MAGNNFNEDGTLNLSPEERRVDAADKRRMGGGQTADNPVTAGLQNFSRGVVDFVTGTGGSEAGGGAQEFATTDVPNGARTALQRSQDFTQEAANRNAVGTPDARTASGAMNFIRSVDGSGNTIDRPGYTNQSVSSDNKSRLAELANINTAPTAGLLDAMFPNSANGGSGAVARAGGAQFGRDEFNDNGVPFVTTIGQQSGGDGDNSIDGLIARSQSLREDAGRTNDMVERSNLIGQAKALEAVIRPQAASNVAAGRDASDQERTRMNNDAQAGQRSAIANQANATARNVGNNSTEFDVDLFNSLNFQSPELGAAYLKTSFQRQKFSEGGLVQHYAGGGLVNGGGVEQPQVAELQAYSQYTDGARSMGLPAIPFEKFLTMRQGAATRSGAASTQAPTSGAEGVLGLAEGGVVPGEDVSGKMVVDSDPNAPTDSIPAVIDGQHPAALDSGELVFPKAAVLFYGTDKLNKMIEKANENGDSGQQQQPAPGVSAISAALG
jgi:hypothetical protein